MRDEIVVDTLVFSNFGRRLMVDIGDHGSVRFITTEPANVQLDAAEFAKLVEAVKNRGKKTP